MGFLSSSFSTISLSHPDRLRVSWMASSKDPTEPSPPPQKKLKDDDPFYDSKYFDEDSDESEDEERERQYWIFEAQAVKSQGFDIDLDNFDYVFPIRPVHFEKRILSPKVGTDGDVVRKAARFALERYNEQQETNLEFYRVLKANWMQSAGYTFWITFEVIDPSSCDKQPKVYQTKLIYCIDIEVIFCRPKPTEEEMAPYYAKLPACCFNEDVPKNDRRLLEFRLYY